MTQKDRLTQIKNAAVYAAAEVMWNDRDARMGGLFSERNPKEVIIVHTMATAQAALEAAETARERHLDSCEFCHGAKGGAPGNENRLNGVIVCDHCLVLIDKAEKVRTCRPPLQRELMNVEDAIALLSAYATSYEEQTFGPHEVEKGQAAAAVKVLEQALAHPLHTASKDQLRLNLRRLISYARWQMDELRHYHPTLPSAVGAARAALGDLLMVKQPSLVSDAMFHAADEARNAVLREDCNDQIGGLIAALEAAVSLIPTKAS